MTRIEKIEEARRTARVLSVMDTGFSIIKLHRLVDNSRHLSEIYRHINETENELRALSHAQENPSLVHKQEFLRARLDILACQLDEEQRQAERASAQLQSETFICLKTSASQDSTKRARERSDQLLRRLYDNGFAGHLVSDLRAIDVLKAYFDEPTSKKTTIDPYHQIPLLTLPQIETAVEGLGYTQTTREVACA
jgi:regulator of replication initiation timing